MNWITDNPRRLVLMVVLTVAALTAAFGEEAWRTILRYDRELVSAQGWRLITAHIVHASWSHALMNLAGLWVVWLLFSQRLAGWAGLFITAMCIVIMDLGFYLIDKELFWYVGMSGLLHGFYAAGALDEVWRGIKGGVWLLMGIIVKLTYEQFLGALPMTAQASGVPVWVNSHLYGAVGGLLAAIILNVPRLRNDRA